MLANEDEFMCVFMFLFQESLPCPGSSSGSTSPSSSGFCGSLSTPPATGASSLLLPPPGSTTDLDYCCSLLNDIWKYCANDDKEVVDVQTDPSNPHPFISVFTGPRARPDVQGPNLPVSENQGSYFSTPPKARVIVSTDVEMIGPDEHPHHPLDRQFLSSASANSPKKMMCIRKPWGIAINSKTEQVLSPPFSCRKYYFL